MIGRTLFLCSVLICFGMTAASASASGASLVRFGPGVDLPSGFHLSGALGPGVTMTVEVSLRPSDPEGLSRFVAEVSDPKSPDYRHYLAKGVFASEFGASKQSIAAVVEWLQGDGLKATVDPDHLGVSVTAPAARIESAFGIGVERYSYDGASRFSPSAQPLVPSDLESSIQGVLGLTDIGTPEPLYEKTAATAERQDRSPVGPSDSDAEPCAAATSEATASGAYTSDELAEAYSMSNAYSEGRVGAGVTVALYELEPFSSADIASFQSCYSTSSTVSVRDVDGGPGQGVGTGESALDIEQVIGLAPEASVDVYEGPSYTTATPAQALNVYQAIADDDVAQVVSTSWGECEASASLSPGFFQSEETVFEQMAAQGQSVFAASGDSGSEDCFSSEDPVERLGVDDPGSQPYVTSVGGTSLETVSPRAENVWNACAGQPESQCAVLGDPRGASGGGISENWSMPSWQSGPGVTNSFSSGTPCGDTTGDCREVPDVSASADPLHGVVIYFDGSWQPAGGTSASSPLWAAVTAVIDQGCFSASGSFAQSKVVGFADPLIYALGAQSTPPFNDVTSGNNDFTDSNHGDYPATSHYDMATGWGSPNVSDLLGDMQPAGGCPSVTGVAPGGGVTAGGTQVTISGSDLSGATAVDFGQIPATSFSYNPSTQQIDAVAPAYPSRGIVNVTVTTSAGTSGPSAFDGYDYTGPSVDHVVPPAGDPAGGVTVAISGGGFAGATAVYFCSTDAASFSVASDTEIMATSPAEPDGTVCDITVVTPVGTSPKFAQDHYTFTLDPVTSSIEPASGSIRGGTLVSISGANFGGTSAVYFGSVSATFEVVNPETIEAVSPRSTASGAADVTVATRVGSSGEWGYVSFTYETPQPGYWLAASDGGVFSYGGAGFYGSMGGSHLNDPVVGLSATPDDGGYWLVGSDGGVFAFGDAGFYGSMGAKRLAKPVVGMAAAPGGDGYWLVGSDGGVFAFGDAGFYGSMGNVHLNAPVVAIAATPDGRGYWLIASDGGVFAFGDAGFYGSMGNKHLNAPVVGAAAAVGGGGYWLVASDGGVFAFGDAGFYGSMGNRHLNAPMVGMASSATGAGYWLVGSDGGIFSFGAPFSGSAAGLPLVARVVGAAPT